MTGLEAVVAGRYRILRALGAGGMGRVWLARDEVLRRDVAIKEIVLPFGLPGPEREELRLRTLREARAAARLSHSNVVRIYDVQSGGEQPWIVMEYVHSRSLLQVIEENGPLPVEQVAGIGLAVLSALDAANRVGVLHRDVKPSNVLIADDGRVVLTDFGSAMIDEGDGALTRTGVIPGSPQYIAPERVDTGVSTPEADLWSAAEPDGSPRPQQAAGTPGRVPPQPAGAPVGLHPADSTTVRRLPAPAPVPRGRRWRLGVAAAVTTVLIPLAAVAASADKRAGSHPAGGRPRADAATTAPARTAGPEGAGAGERPPSAPASPSAPPTGFVLPARFLWWRDRTGYRVARPATWSRQRETPAVMFFCASGGPPTLRVKVWDDAGSDLVAALTRQEGADGLPDYRRFRIESERPAAVWEYEYTDPEAGRLRGLDRAFVAGNHTYVVQWRTPSATWNRSRNELSVVLASFRPATA